MSASCGCVKRRRSIAVANLSARAAGENTIDLSATRHPRERPPRQTRRDVRSAIKSAGRRSRSVKGAIVERNSSTRHPRESHAKRYHSKDGLL